MPDKGLWRKGWLWGVPGMLLAVPTFSEIGLNNVTSSLQQFEDLELTRRSQAGDTEAFGELVTKYRAKILAMLYGMVRDENDAWDLAQEGFLQAWRSIHRFEGRSSFYTWLYRLTVNLAIESLRRKGRREEVELDDAIPCSLPSPRANYQRNEIRQHINAALAQLSPEHRAVIVLKEIEDLQYQEIAEILNLSIGTVMSRLFYGRKKLQSMLRPIYNQIYQTRPSVSVPFWPRKTTARAASLSVVETLPAPE
jgi:RNA polymerase sigma-70 factor, ECF subfamily